MIWIDLENRLPTDTDIPGWTAWSQEKWDAWLKRSQELVSELAELEAAGQREARNALIDANSWHWAELKPWLLALSHGKCWFSEARELYSHYDVEHFRPKKQAKALEGDERDGYWWLAFNYMNFRACGNVGNRKKGGWFPLRTGSMCSTYAAQCEESEAPYLIDPIDEDDVQLLAFNEEGNAIPRPGCSDWDRQRVEETVKRLKLNEHPALSDERRKVWQQVDNLIEQYNKAKARNDLAANPAAKEKLKHIRQQMRALISPKAELSSVAKWCVKLRNDQQLLHLIA
ncbi:hypothetical protein [Chitiniphilus eburneus]|uniref:TIGR02646 family protein n=1 Tax=Chitiniphilus eburneus TaxID=2571148 RepID=A0A4U0Q056_9NEIS|nr:hypothetical protein [Chitiniphilus eburneus]TJZ74239.1 hypothetical protein FAZ21_08105 [Chitiniphilus eburneus]